MVPSIPRSKDEFLFPWGRFSRDPFVPTFSDPLAGPEKSFEGTHLFNLLTKKYDRLPTRLLAQNFTSDIERAIPPHPAALRQAEIFRKNGENHFETGEFKKALACYRAAHRLVPQDKGILHGLARSEAKAKNWVPARDYYDRLIALSPGHWIARAERFAVNSRIAENRAARGMPPIELSDAEILEGNLDKAARIAVSLSRQLEDVKLSETYLAEWRNTPQGVNLLKGSFLVPFYFLTWAQLPFPDRADRQFVPDRLRMLATEHFAVWLRFAKADPDPAIRGFVPLLEAYHALFEEREADAKRYFTQVQEEGFRALGDGDAALGRKQFYKRLEEVERLIKIGKPDQAWNLFQEQIPLGLADAYRYLKPYDGAKTRLIGLLAIGAWEEDIRARYQTLAEAAGASDERSDPSLRRLEEEEISLVHAVRDRLAWGISDNIESALLHVQASEQGKLKELAATALWQINSETSPGLLPLSQIFSLASTPWMDPKTADLWLYAADTAEDLPSRKNLQILLYSAVQAFSPNQAQRNQAEAALGVAL